MAWRRLFAPEHLRAYWVGRLWVCLTLLYATFSKIFFVLLAYNIPFTSSVSLSIPLLRFLGFQVNDSGWKISIGGVNKDVSLASILGLI